MVLHQEEKSNGCCLMVQQSGKKVKEIPILQEGEGENESEDVLFQNLNPLLTNPAPPPREHVALAGVPTALAHFPSL